MLLKIFEKYNVIKIKEIKLINLSKKKLNPNKYFITVPKKDSNK